VVFPYSRERIPPGGFLLIEILPSGMTKLAMLSRAKFAQALPSYKAAETIIEESFGMKVSDTYIGRVTGYVGGRVYETGKEKSREAYENMPRLEYKENSRKGVFYIMTDGSMALTGEKSADGSGWREVRPPCFTDENLKRRGTDKNGGPCFSIPEKEAVSGQRGRFQKVRPGCRYEKSLF
jgi:hypothetical protein